jgi:hypothetical protein
MGSWSAEAICASTSMNIISEIRPQSPTIAVDRSRPSENASTVEVNHLNVAFSLATSDLSEHHLYDDVTTVQQNKLLQRRCRSLIFILVSQVRFICDSLIFKASVLPLIHALSLEEQDPPRSFILNVPQTPTGIPLMGTLWIVPIINFIEALILCSVMLYWNSKYGLMLTTIIAGFIYIMIHGDERAEEPLLISTAASYFVFHLAFCRQIVKCGKFHYSFTPIASAVSVGFWYVVVRQTGLQDYWSSATGLAPDVAVVPVHVCGFYLASIIVRGT